MKLPTKPKTNTPPPPVAELEAKRSELTARLADVTAQAGALDPLADWERAGSVAAQGTALQNALDALDAQLVTARRLAAEEARAAAEAAKYERTVQALAGARTAARATFDVLQHFDKTVLADLDKAAQELAQAGGYYTPEVGHVVNLRQQVTRTLENLRSVQPEWFGLPKPPTREEQALAEARRSVDECTARLESLRKEAKRPRFAGEPSGGDFKPVIVLAAYGLQAARARLMRLTEPGLSEDEVFERSVNGLGNELDDYIGRHYENQRQRAAKETRESRANQPMEALAL